MQLPLATLVAITGLLTVIAIYFVWVRKLDKKEEQKNPS
jgi:hypothetical protein